MNDSSEVASNLGVPLIPLNCLPTFAAGHKTLHGEYLRGELQVLGDACVNIHLESTKHDCYKSMRAIVSMMYGSVRYTRLTRQLTFLPLDQSSRMVAESALSQDRSFHQGQT